MVMLYNCCTMHTNTHSVHSRLLKLWRVRLPSQWPCCYVSPPPLSGTNCCPLPFSGGLAPPPPSPKWLPFPQAHTPSPLSVTCIVIAVRMEIYLGTAWFYFYKSKMVYVLCIKHCGENSQIFPDAADQTLPVTEYSEIDNWNLIFQWYISQNSVKGNVWSAASRKIRKFLPQWRNNFPLAYCSILLFSQCTSIFMDSAPSWISPPNEIM